MRKKKRPTVKPLLYRARTVAALTDQSLSKIYKDIENGQLGCVRLGNSVRVPADALEIYLRGDVAPQ
jgi:excisionase family DNA binding protein